MHEQIRRTHTTRKRVCNIWNKLNRHYADVKETQLFGTATTPCVAILNSRRTTIHWSLKYHMQHWWWSYATMMKYHMHKESWPNLTNIIVVKHGDGTPMMHRQDHHMNEHMYICLCVNVYAAWSSDEQIGWTWIEGTQELDATMDKLDGYDLDEHKLDDNNGTPMWTKSMNTNWINTSWMTAMAKPTVCWHTSWLHWICWKWLELRMPIWWTRCRCPNSKIGLQV